MAKKVTEKPQKKSPKRKNNKPKARCPKEASTTATQQPNQSVHRVPVCVGIASQTLL